MRMSKKIKSWLLLAGCFVLVVGFSFLEEGHISFPDIRHLLLHIGICVLVCELIHGMH